MPVDYVANHGPFEIQAIVTDPPWYENCYIVSHVDSGDQIIFDPGGNAGRILETVTSNEGKVIEILLTHAHPDHIGAVREIQEKLGVECRAHKAETTLLASVEGFSKTNLGYPVTAPKSFKTFDDDATFSLGGKTFTAIPCPGHTPGGITFDFGDFALTGDTLFNHGVGRTDFPGGNGRQLMDSITGLLERLRPDCLLYCGHGPIWSVDEAREWWFQMLKLGPNAFQ